MTTSINRYKTPYMNKNFRLKSNICIIIVHHKPVYLPAQTYQTCSRKVSSL